MFTAALFTIAKMWKQQKYPSTDEWINKQIYRRRHIYTMGYYSAIKKNGFLIYTTIWMDLENIMLNEISQMQRDKYCMIPFI